MTTRITSTDVESGFTQTVEITNDYVLICDGDKHLESAQTYANGTTVLTIKKGPRP